MKQKSLILLIALGCAIFLMGCVSNVTIDVFVQDILDVVEGEEDVIMLPAVVSFESPGELEEAIPVVKEGFPDAVNFREQSRDVGTFILADIKVPLILYNTEFEDAEENMFLLTLEPDEDNDVFIWLDFDRRLYDRMAQAVKDEFWHDMTIEDLSLNLNIQNDLRAPVEFELMSVFVNGEPYPYPEFFVIERREILGIKLSDVLLAYAYEFKEILIGVMYD